ncbi:Protein kinase superfamily protein [Hirschfeldia incana]|nr:Protein kinase superfamily protein [Hirschfeldia incana]
MQEDSQPQEPSESMDSSGTINGKDGDLDEQGDNEFLNHAWLNNIQIPDNLYPQDANPNPLSLPRLTHFTLRWQEILDGTQNLHNTNLLGRGDSSEVFRCDFPRFDKVGAAKIRDLQDGEAHPEFVAEIKALHRAHHPNVIKLLGKCVNREHCVIVHEFMPKGSLDHYLFAGSTKTNPVLDWYTRMRIAVGVAEALVYVHEELKMIHRDVRASKVILDEDLMPKLSGFGLATRIVENENGVEQQSEISRIKGGTAGCIAPETEWFGLVSTKSDVYSYGVFLLTLFTGRKAFDLEKLGPERTLTDWLMPVLNIEECMPLVLDAGLARWFSVEGLVRLFDVARMCLDQEVVARPNMRLVALMVRQAADYEVLEWPPVTKRSSI